MDKQFKIKLFGITHYLLELRVVVRVAAFYPVLYIKVLYVNLRNCTLFKKIETTKIYLKVNQKVRDSTILPELHFLGFVLFKLPTEFFHSYFNFLPSKINIPFVLEYKVVNPSRYGFHDNA